MLLEIENLKVKYGNVEALHGINFHVDEGEIVCILGANGAGKSTTLMALSGLVKASEGTITYNGEHINKARAHDIVKSGIAQVPEGRRVFGTLTVFENLKLGAFTCDDHDLSASTLEWIYKLFPILKEREQQLAGTLSGGEQQMLAIGRALMAQPKVLLLDEPSLGLAPLVIKTIFETVKEINSKGVTIILVEQNAKAALKLSNRGYVMEVGRLTMEDDADALLQNEGVRKAYLGG
ncbi:MAG: ABC transporter ATP-binding protein [Desulfobacterales bacterium]|nr:ABC transporter ATP-binding protein [Desulfobacterales bacterium]MCP4158567.1 ABC transporter ATP-binding protein [Deltaproteobacteria bacterium]